MDVYIVGIGMTTFGRLPQQSVKSMTREAVGAALKDAECDQSAIQAAWFANTRQAMLEGQNTVRGQCALRAMGFEEIPIINVENACASSSTGLLSASAHIKAGFCDVALVVGAEKMYFPENPEGMAKAFLGGTDIYELEATHKRLRHVGDGIGPAQSSEDSGAHSFFMDSYAAFARLHMKTFGTTREQIAAAAAKNHHHSVHNAKSQYRFDMTVEQVLTDRPVVWPLTRAMCAPISDGAAALILCNEKVLDRFNRRRAVKLAACALVSGTNRRPEDFDRHIGRLAATQAYDQAGIDPLDVDVAEVHDATAYSEIQQIENLGFFGPGEGGPRTLRGDTTYGGAVVVNPSGGLVSRGHPIGATGAAQIHELVLQLRGEAGARQVQGARCAMAENGGGFLHVEEAATVCTILTQ